MDTDTHITMKIIDIHNHSLPGVDDGSLNIEMTDRMFKKSVEQNVTRIFLTPHVNSSVTKAKREKHFEIFKKIYTIAKSYNLDIYLGAEIYIPYKIPEIDFSKYLMGNSNAILVEFSPYLKTPIVEFAFNLKKRGYKIIVAHIERYEYLTIENIIEMKSMGIYIQLNGNSILNKKNKYTYKKSKNLIKLGLIDFIASDAHNDDFRKPNLKNSYIEVKKLFGETTAKKLFYENQKELFFKN